METSHPIRHRVGIVLVCLVALVTARNGWNLRVQRLTATGAPVAEEPAAKEHAPEQRTFEIADPEPFRQAVLRPICALDGAADLPCCDLTFDPPAEVEAEFVFALTPETFPLMSQFVTGMGSGRDASIDLETPAGVTEMESVQADSYVLWFPTVRRCGNIGKDSQGKEYCAPEDTVEVPEPASVALMLAGSAALVLRSRGR
jgi:hypothetical protein